MRTRGTTNEVLLAELAEAGAGANERCNYTCKHLSSDGISCARAKDHAGATFMIDRHIYLLDGVPHSFGEECCADEKEGE